jgi:very-short-patch-repair endonuclease
MRRDSYYQEHAKELRSNMTNGEKALWSRLRAHRMEGRKFRRQHAISSYIVDFVCLADRLIIEIDGDSHFMDDRRPGLDAERTAYLEKLGFRVLRFGNRHVLTDLDSVAGVIFDELQSERNASSRPAPQPTPQRGEGDSETQLSGQRSEGSPAA